MTNIPPELWKFLPNLGYAAIALWLFNKLWDIGSGSHKKLIEVTQGLTIAMVELRVELRHLNEKINDIPKLKNDVNSLGEKLRHMQDKNKTIQ